MKQPIKPEDIRKGDLIRFEFDPKEGRVRTATEYVAPCKGYTWGDEGQCYLMDRPVPPFEPYWGMVIGNPSPNRLESRAVYIREDEKDLNWLVFGSNQYQGDEWAKQKLAEGWEVIEKPDGVK